MIRTLVCSLVMMFLTGCHVGPRVENMPFVRDPAGADVVVIIKIREPEYVRERHEGELLEVSATDGLLVAVRGEERTPRLTWLNWNAIHEVKATQIPSIGRKLWLPDVTQSDLVENLTVVARYPQGLSPALRDQLLAGYGQPEFDVVEAMDRP